MCDAPRYTIHKHQIHHGWDNSFAPVETVAPGTTLTFDCLDAGSGHFTAASTAADVATMDFAKTNPVNGPIAIDGAEPGDAVKVTFHGHTPSGLGWTANIPGFGLLADQFPDPALIMWSYDTACREPAAWGTAARVPLKPFNGTIGLAPAEPGTHSIIPPRRVGGNMDIRDIAAGCVLYLPVEVAGALFSIGDPHAAQGDGEVCGTAIETAMGVTVTLDLVKGANLAMPRYETPGPVARHLDADGFDVTTGIGPDLMENARTAVAQMVDLLAARHGIAPVEAYMLASVAGDLKIPAIVDAPNWIVSFAMPRTVFA